MGVVLQFPKQRQIVDQTHEKETPDGPHVKIQCSLFQEMLDVISFYTGNFDSGVRARALLDKDFKDFEL